MKKYLLAIALFISLTVVAQEIVKDQQYSINLGFPGLSLAGEFRIAPQSTILASAGYGILSINTVNVNRYRGKAEKAGDVSFPKPGIAPFISLENRNYYNLQKRLSNGKLIENNSGNYWGLRATAFLPPALVVGENEHIKTNYRFGAIYGLQRSFGNGGRWLFNFNTGISMWANYNFSFISAGPALNASMGYRLK